MQFHLRCLVLLFCLSTSNAQKFQEESPYLKIRLMDMKLLEWKPITLNAFEKVLDAELKYTDERKGTACKTIAFEQEVGYPKQDARFLDISIRGICTDDKDKKHPIEKDLITKAIIQKKDEVNALISGIVLRVGHVPLYQRDRNKLNYIIIPSSIGFTILLFLMTFFLRRMRARQKRDHIVAELQKKREASQKKVLTIPNIDPHANDKQRLLQLDPKVVGNVSHTMGSSKQFTNDQYATNSSNATENRTYNRQATPDDEIPPPIPSKENRAPYYKREEENPFQTQRTSKTNRERMHVPFENESRYSPTHSQFHQESQHLDMLSMQEQQPRVVVRSIRDEGNFPSFYPQHEESSSKFVSIPVQIEQSIAHQRFMPTPYHSDPYYPNVNS